MVTVHIEKDTCVWWSCRSPVKHALFDLGMVSPVLELFRVELPSVCLCTLGLYSNITHMVSVSTYFFCLPLVG